MTGPLHGRLPPGWTAASDSFGPVASHPDIDMAFRLLRGGTYRIGLSDDELAAARRLSPVPHITVEEVTPQVEVELVEVLVAELPVQVRIAHEAGIEVIEWAHPPQPEEPALLSHEFAVLIAHDLGGRLPSEAEWETCCRAGSSTLFPWGNDLVPDAELEVWLDWNLDRPDRKRNALGFSGLFFGEWCHDEYRVSHAPDAEVLPGIFTVKSGGAQFWPWQGAEEWVWCMPAMRTPSTSLDTDGTCAARIVVDLPR